MFGGELLMTDKQKKIAIIVIFVLAICWMVPACHWDSTITSGRFVSEASIVEMDRSADSMTVRLYNSSADESKVETSTYLTLGGMIPEDAYMSERVMIGYSKDGLYADTKQTVEVSFFKKGNLITAYVLPRIQTATVDSAARIFNIIDVQSDGTLLTYNVAR